MVSKCLSDMRRYIIEETNRSEYLFVPYGALGVFGFFAFYFFNSNFISAEVYENIPLRIIAATLSLFLIFKNYWPKQLKRLMPIYWHLTLLFNLPFFFTFMILQNPHSPIWPLHGVHALTVLILMVDWLLFVLLSVVGITIGTIFYNLTASNPQLPDNFSAMLVVYSSIIVFCALFSQKNSAAHKERLNSMKVLAGAIAHELRTPLSAISMISQMLRANVPVLVTGYKQAKQTDPDLDGADEEYMEQVPDEIDLTTRNAFGIIDMLLMNLKDGSEKTAPEPCSMNSCIKNALKSYPMTADERALVHFETPDHDFTFEGNDLFMRHVLFNLLKNALHYVKAANKGAIFIRTEETGRENRVIFKDTGMGMPANMVPHVFDRFYSRTQHGTGIGLAFCKSVLEGIGGKISCESIQGEHTTFILSIPKSGR